MNKEQLRRAVLIGLPGLVLMSSTQAGNPVWTFTPVQGFPNSVTLGATGTATIKYTVTNLSHKTHTLVMKPISGITSSGCTSSLGDHQSCTLSLEVNGSALSGDVTSGPVLCDQGNASQCYQPSSVNSLKIVKTQADTTLVAVGLYNSGNNVYRPLLAVSQNSGSTWTYPGSITSPDFAAPNSFTDVGGLGSSSCAGNTCIAVGQYRNVVQQPPSSQFHPLLALSQDSGSTWTYPESIVFPIFTPSLYSYQRDGFFNSASCAGSTCIAVGSYTDGEIPASKVRPLLALSQDSGSTWTYPGSITAPQFIVNNFSNGGAFSGSSCSGSLCIAVGSYLDNENPSKGRPLLALSQDSGSTWTYPESITVPQFNPYNYVDLARFYKASCSDHTCIAVGSYKDGSVTRPLLALSQDSGSTWTYSQSIANIQFTATVPPHTSHPFTDFGLLNSASCSGSTCIAAGLYSTTLFPTLTFRPLLAVSQDSGSTWVYPQSITDPLFPFNTGAFNSVSCSGSICMAVGYYTDNSGTFPLLALSHDSGSTWTYPESIRSTAFLDSSFSGASCIGSICIAVGSYADNSGTFPLLALSHDSGSTWTYTQSITTPVFTAPNMYPYASPGGFSGATSTRSLLPKSLQNLTQLQFQLNQQN